MAERAYIRDGMEIYRRSFAIIRAEAELGRFSALEERVAVRMIHACGMTEIARDLVLSPDFAERARQALREGAAILCDSKMVAQGITRTRMPQSNPIVCTIDDPTVPGLAERLANTRTAAAMELWRDRLAGAVIGLPVGFVGAMESKEALAADGRVPFLIVRGRKGGSAMAVAAVNALA